jgi:Ca-activated chloride channel family protein
MTPRLVRILVALSATALVSPLATGGPPLGAQSPTAKLQGHVRDSLGRALPAAHVIVIGTAYQANADSSGYYFINSIPSGRYEVEAHANGHKTTRMTGVRMRAGFTRTLDFAMAVVPDSSSTLSGYVRDTGNVPVPNARIVVVGTTHTAVANVTGFFRITDLPPGKVDVRASFVGYRPVELRGVSLKPGVETTVGISVVQTAVDIQEITIVAAEDALVPRDQVTTKQLIGGGYVDGLPVDRLSNVFTMQPGVPVNGGSAGRVAPNLQVATNAFEDASVTTGATAAEFLRPRHDTEGYNRIVDNPFRSPGLAPLSTFGLDVDRASYANVRRFIAQGQRPPADAVRIEELINYFTYDYPSPARGAEHPFTITTEVAEAPWAPAHRLVRIGLQSRPIAAADLPANNLVFLIDVSGSMAPANKLPLVQQALGLLVEQLRPQDRVAIVVYAGSAGLVLESTSGADQPKILESLGRLRSGGSTAGGAGLRLAYQVANDHHITGGNNRVIIATDGDFNVGASSDAEMERLIEQEREHGTFLTVLGFGMGNYKDSKLELLADKGNGNYAYIDNLMEARKVLVQEMGGTLLTVAKDVKLQVEFNPTTVQAWRLIGYENRLMRDEDFNNDRKDGGELGAGHSVTALYEVVPVGVPFTVALSSVDSLRYQSVPAATASRGGGRELLFVKVRYKDPEGAESRLLNHAVANRVRRASSDFQFASAVAAFGMLLRDSEYRGSANTDLVLAAARRGMGADPQGHRAGFVKLVEDFQRTQVMARVE